MGRREEGRQGGGCRLTTVTTKNDFENETAWERAVLAYALPVIPLASSGATLDLRTNTTTISVPLIVETGSGEELLKRLLPLLFGAAWKVLDLALELALAGAGLAPGNGRRWTIQEKSQHASAGRGSLPGLSGAADAWSALGALYARTTETRHALVHRRVRVNPSTLELTGHDPGGSALPPVSYEEQMALCRLSQRVGQAIGEGTLRPRVEADLRKHLADLRGHHGVAVSSHGSEREPVRVVDDLPADGEVDVPYLLDAALKVFPGRRYVDAELRLEDGRALVGELESAPQRTVRVDPAAPPDWLSYE